ASTPKDPAPRMTQTSQTTPDTAPEATPTTAPDTTVGPALRTASHAGATGPGALTGRAKNLALTGLFMSMFVSMLAMNVVGTSMPIIIADIGGTQAAFTWVVTATML